MKIPFRFVLGVFVLTIFGIQTSAFAESEFGFHGGVSSDITANTPIGSGNGGGLSSTSPQRGYLLGIDHKSSLGGPLYLQTELNYLQRGASLNTTINGASASETLNMGYLEVPLMIRAEADLGLLHPYLLAGPSIGFAINRTASAQDATTGTNIPVNGTGAINPLTVGMNAGVGLELKLGDNVGLQAEGRYYYGLSDIDPAGSGVYQRGLIFQTGIAWHFDKPSPVGVEAYPREAGYYPPPPVVAAPSAYYPPPPVVVASPAYVGAPRYPMYRPMRYTGARARGGFRRGGRR